MVPKIAVTEIFYFVSIRFVLLRKMIYKARCPPWIILDGGDGCFFKSAKSMIIFRTKHYHVFIVIHAV